MAQERVVEEALDEVIDGIQSGSPLSFNQDLRAQFRDLYQEDFEEQLVGRGVDFSLHKQRILRLARLIGSLAATLTMLQAIEGGEDIPAEVDADSALYAGFLVARLKVCPATVPEGHFCTRFPEFSFRGSGSDANEAVVESLRSIFGRLGFLDSFR